MAAQTSTIIGQSIPRLESDDKVTGRAEYIHTLRLPGMLHAKVFRSDIPHGHIKSIDTADAAAMPSRYAERAQPATESVPAKTQKNSIESSLVSDQTGNRQNNAAGWDSVCRPNFRREMRTWPYVRCTARQVWHARARASYPAELALRCLPRPPQRARTQFAVRWDPPPILTGQAAAPYHWCFALATRE